MKFEFPHSLSEDEALARVQALTTYWGKYGVNADWQGRTARIKGKVKGISFEGTMEIRARVLAADMKVGFLAEKLGGRAYVERKLGEYLDPRKSLEELRART
jgi:hypothetical protein